MNARIDQILNAIKNNGGLQDSHSKTGRTFQNGFIAILKSDSKEIAVLLLKDAVGYSVNSIEIKGGVPSVSTYSVGAVQMVASATAEEAMKNYNKGEVGNEFSNGTISEIAEFNV